MPLQKRIVVQLDGIRLYVTQFGLRQCSMHGGGCIFGAKRIICDLNRQTCRLKQFPVSEVGRDQSALDTAFKDTCKDQAL